MGITVKLNKKVQSEGKEIDELTFREAIGEDIAVCGYPFRIYVSNGTDVDAVRANEQEAKLDTLVLTNLAARLAGVPKSTIKNLSVKDYQQVVDVVMSFFG